MFVIPRPGCFELRLEQSGEKNKAPSPLIMAHDGAP